MRQNVKSSPRLKPTDFLTDRFPTRRLQRYLAFDQLMAYRFNRAQKVHGLLEVNSNTKATLLTPYRYMFAILFIRDSYTADANLAR